MSKKILVLFGTVLLVMLLASCGQTYELQSIEVEPTSPNMIGIGGTQQFTVTAHYSNTKSTDISHRATYTITPPPFAPAGYAVMPNAVTISPTGFGEVVQGACTWSSSSTTDAKGNVTTVFGTTPYTLTVSFEGKQAVSFVSVASIAGCKFQ